MTIIEKMARTLIIAPGLTAEELAERTGIPRRKLRCALSRLSKKKAAHCLQDGLDYRWFTGEAPKPSHPSIAKPARINKMEGRYDCPELRATPYRPGAMDAFKVPSRGIG